MKYQRTVSTANPGGGESIDVAETTWELEELVGLPERVSKGPGGSHWIGLALGCLAAVVCLGFGGRALWEGSASMRAADPMEAPGVVFATASVRGAPQSNPAPTQSTDRELSFALRRFLPVEFTITRRIASGSGTGNGLVVSGVTAGSGAVQVRLVDADGSVLGRAIVDDRGTRGSPTNAHAWTFAVSVRPPSGRSTGPDALELEISWRDGAGVALACRIPLALSGSDVTGVSGEIVLLDTFGHCA